MNDLRIGDRVRVKDWMGVGNYCVYGGSTVVEVVRLNKHQATLEYTDYSGDLFNIVEPLSRIELYEGLKSGWYVIGDADSRYAYWIEVPEDDTPLYMHCLDRITTLVHDFQDGPQPVPAGTLEKLLPAKILVEVEPEKGLRSLAAL